MLDAVLVFLLIIVLSIFYFLPSMVAHSRGHHQEAPIFLLNLLLGWTFIGWTIALVWAFWTPYPPTHWRR